ncbi:flagellar motor protein MotB [Magnetovibrio sp. PR-2]|uniref:flagellar motor protein MotB n=1 Tax=Magnetovibrio sp. PR-2 TaxID=3120356 RepID=UPI002FCE19A2
MPPPPITEDPVDEEWLVTYADAITLLLAFFVMLVSFSKIDMPLFEEVIAGIQEEIGKGEAKETTTSEVKTKIEDIVFETGMEQIVEVHKDERGVTIEMASAGFFISGTAKIKEDAKPLLAKWAEVLTNESYKFFMIEAEGHTDNDPIHTEMFPSNWELSAARASAVVRELQAGGVHVFQLKAVGFGDAHPKVPNLNPDGTPNKINQAKNRRVAILLTPMTNKLKDQFQDIIVEENIQREMRRREAEALQKQQEVQKRVQEAEKEQQQNQDLQRRTEDLQNQPNTAPPPPVPPAETTDDANESSFKQGAEDALGLEQLEGQ